MILGFHQKGIGVIMDMVYNHMTETSNLDKIVPKYYFRTDALGNFTNGSGCGNELASEKTNGQQVYPRLCDSLGQKLTKLMVSVLT